MRMHELSIAESVVEAVLERTGDQHVTCVRLSVGRLSGVVPDALTFCFELATAGTALEGAELKIIQLSGRAHCRSCDQDFEKDDLILLCECGSADVDVVAGRELSVTSVEVA
jgi:hydrogenase nickel incorporation protein HypA/HybF